MRSKPAYHTPYQEEAMTNKNSTTGMLPGAVNTGQNAAKAGKPTRVGAGAPKGSAAPKVTGKTPAPHRSGATVPAGKRGGRGK